MSLSYPEVFNMHPQTNFLSLCVCISVYLFVFLFSVFPSLVCLSLSLCVFQSVCLSLCFFQTFGLSLVLLPLLLVGFLSGSQLILLLLAILPQRLTSILKTLENHFLSNKRVRFIKECQTSFLTYRTSFLRKKWINKC